MGKMTAEKRRGTFLLAAMAEAVWLTFLAWMAWAA